MRTKKTRNHQKPKRFTRLSTMQKIILLIIGICFAVVIFFLIFSLLNQPETRIKNLISKMSNEYYEDYLYPNFGESESFKENPEKAMELYTKSGFSYITLRQLLLYGDKKNAKYADEIEKYCNIENTTIKFYPDSPYGKSNYHTVYSYSCEF